VPRVKIVSSQLQRRRSLLFVMQLVKVHNSIDAKVTFAFVLLLQNVCQDFATVFQLDQR
jgi:hypothetical protein